MPLLLSLMLALAPQPPIKVMIVGVFHMANPGHDIHNLKVDDVLARARQAEIETVTSALAKLRPTKVAAEWPAELTAERYPQYLAGTLPPSRNEVVQLGFRLAKMAGLKTVSGIDADGDFPWQELNTYAKAHGQSEVVDAQDATIARFMQGLQRTLDERGIPAALRFLNDPKRVKGDNGFYRALLHVGSGAAQPGVDLMTAWYKRNFLICANLIQLAQPGDRIVVFYGYGHTFPLRQCVAETPGFELVELGEFLPK